MTSYSNGWGHLIATIAVMGMMSFLMFFKIVDGATGISLVAPVISFWFLSGAVNRFNPTSAFQAAAQGAALGASTNNATPTTTTADPNNTPTLVNVKAVQPGGGSSTVH